MKKLLSKTNFSLLIITLCAMLFCGLITINVLMSKKVSTAHAEGNANLMAYSTESTYWGYLISYDFEELVITNSFDPTTATGEPIDASSEQDGSLKAYQVDNGDGTYKCVIYADVDKICAPVDSTKLFYGGFRDTFDCSYNKLGYVKSIKFENFDTSNVTNMSDMFYNLGSLTSLDLTCFDTSGVTNMYGMFVYCSSIESIKLSSNFDTSNVTNMGTMFSQCNSIGSIGQTDDCDVNVSYFNTSSVTDMSWMFANCRSLTELNISNFNTTNVTDISAMFGNCISLTSLDLSNFDTNQVSYFTGMIFSNLGVNGNMSQEFAGIMVGLDYQTYEDDNQFYYDVIQIICSRAGLSYSGTVEEAKNDAAFYVGGPIDDGASVPMKLQYLNISSFVINEDADVQMMIGEVPDLKTLVAPAQCNAEVTLPLTMFEQGTTTEHATLSSSSNGKTLVLTSSTTPSTGFVSEKLLPAITIGLASILAVVVVSKKRKYNV